MSVFVKYEIVTNNYLFFRNVPMNFLICITLQHNFFQQELWRLLSENADVYVWTKKLQLDTLK